jgi:DNA-binding transcriptional LysR family regulator
VEDAAAVIDCGGFNYAAEFLHLSQSAVSYTIGKLQDQLGIPLLKMEGRKAHITEEGRELLHRSRNLIKEALEIEAFAEDLRKGWKGEVRLIVDYNFPPDLLMRALRKFSFVMRETKICLSEVTMPQAEKALCEHAADLAICSQVPLGFLGDPLIELEYIAVAHPDHSLFGLGRTIMSADLERQVQIVICNLKDPAYSNNKGHSLGYLHCWKVSSFDSAVGALREGLGYAWLPRRRVRKWLDEGKLAILPLDERRTYKMNFYLIHGRPWVPNTGASRFAEVLHSLASTDASEDSMQLITN